MGNAPVRVSVNRNSQPSSSPYVRPLRSSGNIWEGSPAEMFPERSTWDYAAHQASPSRLQRCSLAAMTSWSDEEQTAVVEQYFVMLEQELVHQPYTKTEHNRRVQQATARSRGSVEFKFSNISAALRDMHVPYIDGYKPRANYQSSLALVVEQFLQERPHILELMRSEVAYPAGPRSDVEWRIVEPPEDSVFPRRRHALTLHTDFVALEASNRTLGAYGELLMLRREQQALRAVGRFDLAERVEHVSQSRGDGLGYDIASFTSSGVPRLIEVKTTRRAEHWPMFVSRNEVTVSRDNAEHFVLARIFHFARPRVGLYELPGAIEDSCILEPETYRALPRPSAA